MGKWKKKEVDHVNYLPIQIDHIAIVLETCNAEDIWYH